MNVAAIRGGSILRSLRIVLFSLVGLVLLALLANYFRRITPLRHLDSVFLFESVDSILAHGLPLSHTVLSWPVVAPMLDWPVARICAAALPFLEGDGYNVLDNHAYFLLYPIAVLARLIGTHDAFAWLNAAAHLALVLMPWVFLRRSGLPVLAVAAFAIAVAAWPAWSLSAMGDYYLDRLYMPLMLGLLYLLHRGALQEGALTRGRLAGIACVALLAAMTTERATIMVLAALLFFVVLALPWRRVRAQAGFWLGLPLLLVAYLAWYFSVMFHGFEGGGSLRANAYLTARALVERFHDPRMVVFALTNLLFLGWMACLAGWRYLLLALGALLPNLIVTTGGAELNGWVTHYHAMYIPFLVFAASIGFARFMDWLPQGGARVLVAIASASASLVLAATYQPFEATFTAPAADRTQGGILRAVYRFYVHRDQSPERAMLFWIQQLPDAVSAGARVSAVEGAMPVLYHSHALALYPSGLDHADVLVISGALVDGKAAFVTGLPYPGNAEQVAQVNACLLERAIRQGFAVEREILGAGLIVLRRSAAPQPAIAAPRS
ncbi:DUF2079 domain-containing protein [Rhodoferax koreensis]|nr:DUF2079 domain-containing protein [Rhodoferax koreense]